MNTEAKKTGTRILILADDLTGTNDTGAAIRKLGHRTCSVVDCRERPAGTEAYTCVSVNVDSRSLPEEEAAAWTRRTVINYATQEIRLYSKRIDSTLRGNLGAETDAFVKGLQEAGCFGEDIAAMIVPAFPHAGRTYHDDTLYVLGVPLEETAAARDPHRPVTTSSAVKLFREQSSRRTGLISLTYVAEGKEAVSEKLRDLLKEGFRNILFEADTEEEIAVIAAAVSESPVPYIAVDPGTFTAALSRELFPGEQSAAGVDADDAGGMSNEIAAEEECSAGVEAFGGTTGRVLAVIGSVNDVARRQTRLLLSQPETEAAVLEVNRLLSGPDSRNQMLSAAEMRLADCIRKDWEGEKRVHALVLSSSVEEHFVSIDPEALGRKESVQELAAEMNDAIAEAAARLLKCGAYTGLYTTGGDITSAVCSRAGINLIEIEDEILPLAVGGRVRIPVVQEENGASEKRWIWMATKGGMIGDENATLHCVYYLQKRC